MVSKNSWVKRNTKNQSSEELSECRTKMFHIALDWPQAVPPLWGCAAVASVGLFPALPSQRTDFILAAERCSLD